MAEKTSAIETRPLSADVLRQLFLYAAVGVVIGVLDKWADESWHVLGQLGHFLGELGTAAGLWAFALALIAWLNRGHAKRGAIDATAFFVSVCAGYYAYSQLAFGYSGVRLLAFWVLASITVVPALTAVLVWSTAVSSHRWTRLLGALAIAIVAAVPIGQAISYGFVARPASDATLILDAVVVAQLMLGVGIVLLLARSPRSRLLCLVLASLAAWPWALALDHEAALMTLAGAAGRGPHSRVAQPLIAVPRPLPTCASRTRPTVAGVASDRSPRRVYAGR